MYFLLPFENSAGDKSLVKQDIRKEYMLGINLTKYIANGKKHHDLSAQKVHYSSDDKTSTLFMPKLKFVQQDGSVWVVTAKRAICFQSNKELDFKKIELYEDVKIQKQLMDETMILTSQTMTYLPKTEKLYTDDDVSYVQNNIRMKARGMEADLSIEKINLHHDIHTEVIN